MPRATTLILLTAAQACDAQSLSPRQIQALLRQWDTDSSGDLSYAEFRAIDVDKKNTEESTLNTAFKLQFAMNDFDGDGKISFSEFRVMLGEPNESGVTMSIRVKEDAAPRGLQELRVTIAIQNQGDKPVKDARLWYSGSGFESGVYVSAPKIAPGDVKAVDMVLSSRWVMHIESIPRTLVFDLKRADGSVIARVQGDTDISWFVGALGPPVFDPTEFLLKRFNVLIFGPKGSGKSAFINSVHAMTQSFSDGEAMRAFVPVHGGAEHCTVRYSAIEGMIDLPLAFWDTWGVSPARYNGNELELIMNGKLPAGWDMDKDITLATENDDDTAYQNKPHAVIFMLPVGYIDDEGSEQMQKIIKEFTKLVRLNVNPLVLLARVDEIDEAVRSDPSSPGQATKNAIVEASRILGIPAVNIIPSVNYISESKKSFEIDRNLWTILHRALSQSKHYLEHLQHQATQAQIQSNPGMSPMMLALNEAKAARDANLMRAEKSEQDAKDLRKTVDQHRERIADLERDLSIKRQEAKDWKLEADSAKERASFLSGIGVAVIICLAITAIVMQPAILSSLSRVGGLALAQLPIILRRLADVAERRPAATSAAPTPAAPAPAATSAAAATPVAPISVHSPTAESTPVSPDASFVQTTMSPDGTAWLGVEPTATALG